MTQIDTSKEAIAALLNGVTEGPLYLLDCGYRIADKPVTFDADGARHGETPNIVMFCETQPNARFFAAARDLVPALAAERDAAEAALKEAVVYIQALVGIRCVWADPAHDPTTKPARAFVAKHGGA